MQQTDHRAHSKQERAQHLRTLRAAHRRRTPNFLRRSDRRAPGVREPVQEVNSKETFFCSLTWLSGESYLFAQEVLCPDTLVAVRLLSSQSWYSPLLLQTRRNFPHRGSRLFTT